MKYIRTKDGIYKYTSHSKAFNGVYATTMGVNHLILYKEIVKHANTIEELCDEFVVIGIFENQIGCCCDTFKEAKELKDFVELPQEQIIYGAIWTDKGLIYVAKMNEKGELELL